MTIYVDELPKSCLDCKFYDTFDLEKEDDVIYFKTYCQLTDKEILDGREVCKNCPLKLISDYTRQVRKEVIDKIRRMSAIDVVNKQYIIETEILDQIQGE